MVFPIAGGNESKGYEISNSLRFNNDDSPKLTFTPSSAGNRRTFTLSVWFKLSVYSTGERVLLAADDGTGSNNNFDYIAINGNDKLFVYGYEGSENQQLISTQVFRDPSAWYHLVVAFDTTDGTASNRIKAYVNGNQITNFDTANYPSQNFQTRFNNNNAQRISSYPDQNASYFDGYMCEYHLVDGSQLAPTSFGKFDTNAVWIPKKYTGSYGTNGFYLEFKQTGTSQNSSGIGADTSGNDSHFTPTNLAATDVTTDTCTNNFCTLNSIANQLGTALSEGNLQQSDTNTDKNCFSTFGLTQGKWYFEVKVPTQGTRGNILITDADHNEGLGTNYARVATYNGAVLTSATDNGNLTTFSNNDILCAALNLDDGEVYFSKNANIDTSGTATITSFPLTGTNRDYRISNFGTSTGTTFQFNFGNPPYAISSGNTDGKYGNFEYAVPSGYYALCTKRLAEFG